MKTIEIDIMVYRDVQASSIPFWLPDHVLFRGDLAAGAQTIRTLPFAPEQEAEFQGFVSEFIQWLRDNEGDLKFLGKRTCLQV